MPGILPSRPIFIGKNTGDLGSLTHGLIGALVRDWDRDHCADPSGRTNLAKMQAISEAVIDANPNATRVLTAEAVSLAKRYLSGWSPPLLWRVHGIELETGAGPVDVAWVMFPHGPLMYDEVKTSRSPRSGAPDPAWVDQARRYTEAAHARHGDWFAGTRLIDLSANRAWVVRHGQPVIPITPEDLSWSPLLGVHAPAAAAERREMLSVHHTGRSGSVNGVPASEVDGSAEPQP